MYMSPSKKCLLESTHSWTWLEKDSLGPGSAEAFPQARKRMTSCALPKNEPAGDASQSTALQSTDYDDEIYIENSK